MTSTSFFSFARLWRVGLALLVGLATVIVAPAEPARAAGTPDLSVSVGGPGRLLFGANGSYGIEACNPSGPAGFNTSFRAVLPPNTFYVSGDATTVITDAPTSESTTLLFENISDSPQGACVSVSFVVGHVTNLTTFDVGDNYVVEGGAYTNTNPFFIPDFDDDGNPISGMASYTGSGTDTATTELIPIEVTKTEPNTELELLRGLHDHQTIYTVRVDNNLVNPTNGIVIDDYLDAGLEFLSCSGDNTTSAATNPGSTEEYSGSGAITGSLGIPPCVVPELVETISIDPDGAGSLPTAVYTHVQWNNGGPGFDLTPGGFVEIQYRAAVPIRENTLSWTGPVPATTGPQAANLDNNSGSETSESDGSEQGMANYIDAAGTYTRNDTTTVPASDEALFGVIAEDLSVHKSVSNGTIGQGNIDTWSPVIAVVVHSAQRAEPGGDHVGDHDVVY